MNNEQSKDNVLKEKSFTFAVRIVKLYQYLCSEKKEFILSKQTLRSGTSIGANVEEAQGGVSKADFSNKIGIAYKEAKETHYWLRLLHETKYIDQQPFHSILEDCDELCRLLFSVLKTTRINSNEQ
jgi:four helix bundle protein